MLHSISEAMQLIQDGDALFIQTAAAAPQCLIQGLLGRSLELDKLTILQMHTEGPALYGYPPYNSKFDIKCFFIGGNLRKAVQLGNADYIPISLSEIPALFRSGQVPVDVALIQVSPPDEKGYCSLGVSIDIAPAVLEKASVIIAQVNKYMPRTFGDAGIHISRLKAMIACDQPLPVANSEPPDLVTYKIAGHVAGLIEDGSTLQMGIGQIPNAVLGQLTQHRRLGVHSEMFSDGVVDLMECGAITNECKRIRKGKTVASFLLGSERLYHYIDNNPSIEMLDIGYVNDPHVIRQNPKVVAINSALEIDLTGQVCADSLGASMYSGVGGQMDFVRGAALSVGGRPIIALPSVTSKGESKIVTFLKPGAGVVTTRASVRYVVTEYGIADLHGKTLSERAKALTAIAHPGHQDKLEERFGMFVTCHDDNRRSIRQEIGRI